MTSSNLARNIFCSVCGTKHRPHQAHVFASNGVANKVESASNTQPLASNAASNKHQRWDRKAYNGYMRVYMMVRRAVMGGRADWWPRRV